MNLNIKISCFWGMLFLLLLNNFTFGQEDEDEKESKFAVGLHIAPSGATWLGNYSLQRENNLDYKLKLGFSAGASVQYYISPRFTLCAEVNYENKGCRVKFTNLFDLNGYYIGDSKQTYHIDYITLPITTKIILNKKGMPFYVNIGGYLGYAVGFGWTNKKGKYANPKYPDGKIKGDVNSLSRLDYGVVTGIGCMFHLSTKFDFLLELRNNLGLNGVNNKSISTYNNEKMINESFALMLGFIYKL